MENTNSLTQNIAIQKEVLLIKDVRRQILADWFQRIRATVHLTISDDLLMNWLERCYAAFSSPGNCMDSIEGNCIFSEFAEAMLASGAKLNDVIKGLLLLQDAVDAVNIGRSDECIASQISTQARDFVSGNITNYIGIKTRGLSHEQDKISSLLRVAQAASSSLALEDVLKVISEEVVRVLDAYGCNAFLFPERSKHGYYCLIDPLPPADYKVPDPPDRFTMEALILKEPVTCYDAMKDPRTDKRTMKYFGLTSLIAFPLVFQGKAVAAGFCCMKDYHHFTQDEIDMVMGIANSGAVGVENARLHEYSIQLATAKERNRLAQEMHDGLAQALAVTKLNLNSILTDDLSDCVRTKVIETKTLVDETYKDIRDTIFGLRAINDLDSDFLDNFKGYLSTFGIHNNLDINFSMREEDINVLSKDAVLQVGRILEEALSNIKKHACARHVWLESGKENDKVWISIKDDGIGYLVSTSQNLAQNHFGIAIMHERAESVDGSITIEQMDCGGTSVRIEIPYSYT